MEPVHGRALLKTLEGHAFEVRAVSVTPDGETILSGSDAGMGTGSDGLVRLWRRSTGDLLKTLTGHDAGARAVSVTLDGETIVSGSRDFTVDLWKRSTGELLNALEGHTSVVAAVCATPDGEMIVSGSSDCTVRVWKRSTGELLNTLGGHDSSVNAVCVTPDGGMIVSGSDDHTVRLWRRFTGELLNTLRGHASTVTAVCVTPDGETIVSGSLDGTVRLWKCSTGLRSFLLPSWLRWLRRWLPRRWSLLNTLAGRGSIPSLVCLTLRSCNQKSHRLYACGCRISPATQISQVCRSVLLQAGAEQTETSDQQPDQGRPREAEWGKASPQPDLGHHTTPIKYDLRAMLEFGEIRCAPPPPSSSSSSSSLSSGVRSMPESPLEMAGSPQASPGWDRK